MKTIEDSMPLWQLTVGEFKQIIAETVAKSLNDNVTTTSSRNIRYVYGLAGIAELFNCSIASANKIKASGRIDNAIIQIGRKIMVDADLALELAGKKK